MQLLFKESSEFVKTKGIGFFEGSVENFENYPIEKKTFIGWNIVNFNKNFFKQKEEFAQLQNKAYYFVHSFFANCNNKSIENGNSVNGKLNFTSVVKKNNVTAFQFHPEKSGKDGLLLLKSITKNIFY